MACHLNDPSVAIRSRRSDFADGARSITPMVLAVVPFGIAIGAVAVKAHMSTATGLAWSILLLGGSAQLAIIQLLDGGAAGVVAVVAALVINARLLVYGAGMAPWFPTTSTRGRLLLAVPLVDQLYLTATTEFELASRDEPARRRFYAGAALHLWIAFITAQVLGALAGRSVPPWLGLRAATSIGLSALLAVAVTSRAGMRAAIGAGIVMAVTSPLGAPSLMLVAMLIGIAAGLSSRRVPVENTP
jgi:predicted branched-subunit amino acid permease